MYQKSTCYKKCDWCFFMTFFSCMFIIDQLFCKTSFKHFSAFLILRFLWMWHILIHFMQKKVQWFTNSACSITWASLSQLAGIFKSAVKKQDKRSLCLYMEHSILLDNPKASGLIRRPVLVAKELGYYNVYIATLYCWQ